MKNGSPVRPAKFAHAVFYTARYGAMKAWYQTVLHAEIAHERDGEIVFLTYDDEHHRVAIANRPDLADRPANTSGLAHLAFTYDTLADLFATYRRLKALAILPNWCVNHGPTTSLYYYDPDRNRIELQVDNFATAEDANAFMRGPEFTVNFDPHAADFDPDRMAALVTTGTPESSLKVRRAVIEKIARGEL